MKGRNILLWIGIAYLLLVVLFAIFGPSFGGGYEKPVAAPFQLPSAEHPLGTDEIGRQVVSRLAYGARVSLYIGLVVQAIALFTGVLMAFLGVYAPKFIGVPILRLTDAMFVFPDILLAILIIGIFGMGTTPVIVALSITAWPAIARLVRAQIATLKDREFVVATQAMGASPFYTITRHVLPQLWGLLLAVSMIELAAIILAESTLSFLGIGVQAPTPSWGTMINNARLDMASHPQWLVWPCLLLSLTVFALNFVGDGIREKLDPRSAKQ